MRIAQISLSFSEWGFLADELARVPGITAFRRYFDMVHIRPLS